MSRWVSCDDGMGGAVSDDCGALTVAKAPPFFDGSGSTGNQEVATCHNQNFPSRN